MLLAYCNDEGVQVACIQTKRELACGADGVAAITSAFTSIDIMTWRLPAMALLIKEQMQHLMSLATDTDGPLKLPLLAASGTLAMLSSWPDDVGLALLTLAAMSAVARRLLILTCI